MLDSVPEAEEDPLVRHWSSSILSDVPGLLEQLPCGPLGGDMGLFRSLS